MVDVGTFGETIHEFKRILEDINPSLRSGNLSPQQRKALSSIFQGLSTQLRNGRRNRIELEQVAGIIEGLSDAVSYLIDENDTFKDTNDEFKGDNDKFKEEIKFLKEEIKSLKSQLEKQTKKLEEMDRLQMSLLTGQIATRLEEELVNRILRKTETKPTQHMTFPKLVKIIDGQQSPYLPDILKTEKEKEDAKRIWKELELEYKLQGNYLVEIKELKKSRVADAHPSLTVDEAKEKLISATMNEHIQEVCVGYLQVLKSLGVESLKSNNWSSSLT